MLVGVVVFADTSIALLFPNYDQIREGETTEEFIIRLIDNAFVVYDSVSFIDQSEIPAAPLELICFVDGDLIVLPDTSINWEGLSNAFSSVPCSIKDGLDKYYNRLHQGITDQDEEYINLVYLHMLNVADNGIAQALIDQVVLNFGEYNLILPV